MNCSTILTNCALVAALCGFTTAANAATVTFSGTRTNIDAPGPAADRCGSRMTVNIRNSPNSTSVGTSNFGAFAATITHCIELPLPATYDLGDFLFEFAPGNSLSGTQSGELTASAPGVFNNLQNYVVTGGTGLFAGATGTFTGIGTLSFVEGPPHGEQIFSGTLDAPAVPEPSTWAMLLVGVGLIAATLHRRMSES